MSNKNDTYPNEIYLFEFDGDTCWCDTDESHPDDAAVKYVREDMVENVATQYVLGIALNKEKTLAAFVRKNRPAWQAGKLNGFGGKIEPKESPIEAMTRKFREESGVDTVVDQWRYLGKFFRTSTGEASFCVHTFVLADDCFSDISQTGDEKVIWSKLDLNEIREKGVYNLHWIVGMALDHDSFVMEVSYD